MNRKRPLPQEMWDQLPAAAQAYIRALEARIATLETTVQHLTECLRQDSRTSSRPPSNDPPQTRGPRRRRTPSGRKPGGQLGHQGHTRALIPLADVARVLPLRPAHCSRCHLPLQGEDPQPYRHQVLDLPPVQPVVTEYQVHRLVCPACGVATRADL